MKSINDIIRDATIAKLSGIGEWRNEKEMWWVDQRNAKITVEWLNDGRVAIKEYWVCNPESIFVQKEYKDGVLNGKVSGFKVDGRPYFEQLFLDGKRHGNCYYWHENGMLEQEDIYRNGKCVRSTRWYENGQLEYVTTIESGKIREVISWDEDGRLLRSK